MKATTPTSCAVVVYCRSRVWDDVCEGVDEQGVTRCVLCS